MNSKTSNQETLSQTPFNIHVRKDLNWDFSEVSALFVSDKNPMLSYLWAAMSAGAPPIESFFIKSLLPTLESISGDEKLLKDCKDMIAQEAQHSAAHAKLNRKLESLGYDMEGAQHYYYDLLKRLTDGLDPIDMLGVVAAGEHALYSLAKIWFDTPAMRESIHPSVRRLFHYHFLEEAEHGAVSHDQYRYFMKNSYRHRLKTAWRARGVFFMLGGATRIFAEGFSYKPTLRDRIDFAKYLWLTPGLMRKMTGAMLGYLSPQYKLNFCHEDIEDIKKWAEELYSDQHDLSLKIVDPRLK